MKNFTLDEVKKHNSNGDAWIVVDGYVYDVSKFAQLHPGGEWILMKYSGKDCTNEYLNFHNSDVMKKYHDRLCIGEITGYKRKKKKQILFSDPIWMQRFNSPYYTESHKTFLKRVRTFVEEEILPGLSSWQDSDRPSSDLLLKMGKQGFHAILCGHPYPVEFCDEGTLFPENLDPFHELILIDQISRIGHSAAISALTNGPAIALSAVLRFGSPELKKRISNGVLMGKKLIALAISEPNAGSDVAGLITNAKKVGNNYLVYGCKKWITNGTYADYFVTAVRTGGENERHQGLSFLLIEKDAPNFSVRKLDIRGSAVSGTAYLDFNGVEVAESNRIGKEGDGFRMIVHNFNHERLYISIIATRLARICLEESIKYSSLRHAFGKPLSNLQSIRLKISSMARRVEMMQTWIESVFYQLCTMTKDEADIKISDIISLLKSESSKVFEMCARETTQIFGGNALYNGVGKRIENSVNSVKAYQIPAGAEDVMDDFASRQIFKFNSKL